MYLTQCGHSPRGMNYVHGMPMRYRGRHQHQSGEEASLTYVPVTDIREEDSKLIFTFEIPGVKKDNIELKVNDERVLSMIAKKFDPNSIAEEGEEIKPSKVFKRSYRFSNRYDLENIHAEHGDGILRLTINEIKPKVKEIEIS